MRHASAQTELFSLSAWRKLSSLASQNVPSEDSDQTDLNLPWTHIFEGAFFCLYGYYSEEKEYNVYRFLRNKAEFHNIHDGGRNNQI